MRNDFTPHPFQHFHHYEVFIESTSAGVRPYVNKLRPYFFHRHADAFQQGKELYELPYPELSYVRQVLRRGKIDVMAVESRVNGLAVMNVLAHHRRTMHWRREVEDEEDGWLFF